MHYYKTQTEFNCGIDLHSRQMYVCVMDSAGEKLVHLLRANLIPPAYAYLRWAFGHAAVIAKRHNPMIGAYAERLTAKHGKFKANAILSAKIARAVYFMLGRNTVFDAGKLLPAKT